MRKGSKQKQVSESDAHRCITLFTPSVQYHAPLSSAADPLGKRFKRISLRGDLAVLAELITVDDRDVDGDRPVVGEAHEVDLNLNIRHRRFLGQRDSAPDVGVLDGAFDDVGDVATDAIKGETPWMDLQRETEAFVSLLASGGAGHLPRLNLKQRPKADFDSQNGRYP